jgi:ATP-dependent dihydroxyacetone kinase
VKKLINRPENVVEEMLQGLLTVYPDLSRLSDYKVLIRSDAEDMRDVQVALISGGGSGHEPAHAGYIGAGMLSAAVAGEVFTSPSADSVLAAIQAVAGKPGVLLIVKNYTGDRLNFGLAAEMARAEGISVQMVVVADDVALADVQDTAGRRGLAGTVLVHKIAGAAAAEGRNLAEVSAIAQAAADAIGTMGVSLSAGTSPAVGKPSFVLGEQEVELGLGIHGEPGVRRTLLRPVDEMVDQLLEPILSVRSFRSGERVAVLINNLGATTAMELAAVARRAYLALDSRGFVVERMYSGTFLSSLDMAGISLSLLHLDDDRLRWLDRTTSAPAWPNVVPQRPVSPSGRILASVKTRSAAASHAPLSEEGKTTKQAIRAACTALLDAESQLTDLDQVVGDGDLGTSLARGARAVQEALDTYPLDDVAGTLKALGLTLQEVLGGSSGPLYGVLFLRAGSSLASSKGHDLKQWAQAATEACEAVSEMGGAKAEDRTMLDALLPFAQMLDEEAARDRTIQDALMVAVESAERGAEATSQMIARRGRSSYLGERVRGHVDPGAAAVAIWLRAVVTSRSK